MVCTDHSIMVFPPQTEINECLSYPCKHGAACTDLVNDFECTCQPGWTGKTCSDVANYCFTRSCINGQCFNLQESSFCRSNYRLVSWQQFNTIKQLYFFFQFLIQKCINKLIVPNCRSWSFITVHSLSKKDKSILVQTFVYVLLSNLSCFTIFWCFTYKTPRLSPLVPR